MSPAAEAQKPESPAAKGHEVHANLDETKQKAGVLAEALPYIKAYSGRVVVIKYGGNAMVEPDLREAFAEDIALLRLVGILPVVVHGGGPQISELMAKMGKEPQFIDGHRVTDAETVEIARMVLVGQVNRDIVGLVNMHGDLAAGVSGEDGNLLRTTRKAGPSGQDLGQVGEVSEVNPEILVNLIRDDFVPVVAPVGRSAEGELHNINADTAAGALAVALGAEKLVYLTNIAGLYEDLGDHGSLISALDVGELSALAESGSLSSGMLPKIASCVDALTSGVHRAHILDGRIEHALLLEVFTPEGIGTMITAKDSPSEADVRRHAFVPGGSQPRNGGAS